MKGNSFGQGACIAQSLSRCIANGIESARFGIPPGKSQGNYSLMVSPVMAISYYPHPQ